MATRHRTDRRALLFTLALLDAPIVTSDFQATLDAAQQGFGFPGATAACVLSDGTVDVAATGVADREAGTPMTKRPRMLAASIGKTFVAATALALDREGVLDLDAPAARITIAFLINTDVGVMDDGAKQLAELERRLLRAVLSAIRGKEVPP